MWYQFNLRKFAIPISGFLLTLVLGSFMLYISWLRWPDLLIDFGREVYVPWRLSEGDVLYRDIVYLYGPFSPYFNALWFKIFGVSLATLFVINFALISLMSVLIYKLFFLLADRLTAITNVVVFIGMFAFAQYLDTGNYNFMAPYSHGATHGILFSLWFIYALAKYENGSKWLWLFGAGVGAGIAVLTKMEIAVAVLLTVLVWHLYQLIYRPRQPRGTFQSIFLFDVGLLLPILFFIFWLGRSLDLANVASAMLLPFRLVLQTPFFVGDFNLRWSGWGEPLRNSALLFFLLALYNLVVWLIYASARTAGQIINPNRRNYCLIGFIALSFLLLTFVFMPTPWIYQMFRPLPLLLGAIVVYWAYLFHKKAGPRRWKFFSVLLLSCLSFSLMLKMVLNARVYHYGFALGLPAVLLMVAVLLNGVPKLLAAHPPSEKFFKLFAVLFIMVVVVLHVRVSYAFYGAKNLPVLFADGDRLIIRNSSINRALVQTAHRLREFVSPNENFVVIPEGIMLNYLTGVPTPSRFVDFFEFFFFDERTFVNDLQSEDPDYVVFVPRNTKEYGYFFGQPNFGEAIIQWVDKNYRPVGKIKTVPESNYEITIFKNQPSREHPTSDSDGHPPP